MSAITSLSDKHVEDIKAGRSDRNLWIYGYDLSVDDHVLVPYLGRGSIHVLTVTP